MKKEEKRIINLVYEDISDRYPEEVKRIYYYMQVIRQIKPKANLNQVRPLPALVMAQDLELFVEEMRNITENVLDMYGLLGQTEECYRNLDLPVVSSTNLVIDLNRYVMPWADLDCFDVYVLDNITDEVMDYYEENQ